ncbi:hypothetical protein ATANTOWER_017088 [Ataeniobius toweri]|uniref:Secreted protein n=1 Tax=Ataeniobius toweri TaxID=208326 RepID=A0ABU7AYZ8_9TELE|nr:hypothetical protein [Ataeniobius toweri]
MNLLTITLAAPLVHAIRTALQQGTVTHLLVHLLTSPPGSKNKEIITNKHHSTPPLSLCGYTHLPPLELHNLIRMVTFSGFLMQWYITEQLWGPFSAADGLPLRKGRCSGGSII